MDIEELKPKIKSRGEIPRPGRDTINFTRYISKQSGKKVLDVGTGSGFIAIYLALNGRDVTASDINPRALEVAKENALNLGANINFIQSDLFDNISQKFDLIIFNPPMGNIKGKKGFEFIKRLVPKTRYITKLASKIFKRGRRIILKKFVELGCYNLNKNGSLILLLHRKEREFIESLVGKDKIEIIKYFKEHDSEIIKVNKGVK